MKILFVNVISLFIVAVVKYQINFHVDNGGAILLPKNTLLLQWTKQIDIHHHFIWYYIENEVLKIKFVYPEKNLAYPLLKT